MSNQLDHMNAVPQAAAVVVAPQPRPAADPKPAETVQIQAQTHVSREAIEAAIREANQALEESATSIRFSTDPDTNGIVVRVTDEATGKVVRQIPTQEQLVIAARMRDLVGVLFNKQI
jgi:flagellar protein FlaG